MPRLLYIANIRLPTEKAHGVQIMKMCEAFAASGYSVTLLVSKRASQISEDPFAYYNVRPVFKIARVYAPDVMAQTRVGYLVHLFIFSLRSVWFAYRAGPSIVYTRDEAVGYLATVFRINTMWESHVGKWNFMVRKIVSAANKIVVISEGLGSHYKNLGVPREQILVAHDGIDLNEFIKKHSKIAARLALGLPLKATIAMYIGALEEWKGYRTFLEASKHVPDITCAIIGGKTEIIDRLKIEYPHVKFLGSRPYRELPRNQQAADILIIPNTGAVPLSSHFTSPLKVFAHMTSRVPIVASDVPSIREVLGGDTAFLVAPDNPKELADSLLEITKNYPKWALKAEVAAQIVSRYTWQERAKTISKLIV